MVSEKLLQELREIMKEEYDIKLEEGELQSFGNDLVDYFETIIKIQNNSTEER